MSRLVRYEGKCQACWMAPKKAAFALHIFIRHIDETATASSTEFCIILVWGDIYDNNGLPTFYDANIGHWKFNVSQTQATLAGESVVQRLGRKPLNYSNIRVFGYILHTHKHVGKIVQHNYTYIFVKLHSIVKVLDFISLIFMDPCIVVWLSRNNQQDATL